MMQIQGPKKYLLIELTTIYGLVIMLTIVGAQTILENGILKEDKLHKAQRWLPKAYAFWDMDRYTANTLKDAKGLHHARSFNTRIINGYLGKARYFNGKDACIKTQLNFKNFKAVTISFWVNPAKYDPRELSTLKKDGNTLSVILDNGHTEQTDFVIQSSGKEPNSDSWVWHCAGVDIFFKLPHGRWTNVVIVADAEEGITRLYINGSKVSEAQTKNGGFSFGSAPLTIGKLATQDNRYFKGSIDEVLVLDKAVDEGRRL